MKELTKEELIRLGVTEVTTDGKVFVRGKPRKPVMSVTYHPFGECQIYYVLSFSDKENHKFRCYQIGRIVLAWFTGSIKANEDCDHINGDTLNNSLSNLQKLSRKENLKKRQCSQCEIYQKYTELRQKYLILKEKKQNGIKYFCFLQKKNQL